jgi:hypothetical protein
VFIKSERLDVFAVGEPDARLADGGEDSGLSRGSGQKECMGYGIGSLLSLGVSVFARAVGLDRDRAF